MKWFIPLLVLILVLSSLATGATRALPADTVTLTKIGATGYTGSATLTTTTKPDGTLTTEVRITSLTSSAGEVITGTRTSAIYSGTCTGLSLPGATLYQPLTSTYVSGTADTIGLKYYFTLPPSPPRAYDPYTIAIAGTDGHVAACVDVGMPSTYKPVRIEDFRITNDPVTAGTLFQDLSSGPLRVAIGLQGDLGGTTFAAYVRKGTCDNLGAQVYQLSNVVDGKSVTNLALDNFLPDGLAVDVEKPGAVLGDYVACTETSPYTVTSKLDPVNSDISGLVTLTEQTSNSSTKVVIKLNSAEQFADQLSEQPGKPPVVPLPASIHRGTCSLVDPSIAYPLNPLLQGTSTTYAPVSINELTRGATSYTILVSKSIGQPNTYVACADILYVGIGAVQIPTPPPGGTPPGMPRTGNANSGYELASLASGALALLMLALGLSLTRRASRRRVASRVRKE